MVRNMMQDKNYWSETEKIIKKEALESIQDFKIYQQFLTDKAQHEKEIKIWGDICFMHKHHVLREEYKNQLHKKEIAELKKKIEEIFKIIDTHADKHDKNDEIWQKSEFQVRLCLSEIKEKLKELFENV